MPELTAIQQIAIWILPVLFAITIHEASHAFVANYFGDTTAKMLGRLSFNPLRHIDAVGTFVVPIIVLLLSHFSFVFGWAKPVPINAYQLRNPRRDLALATAAGPLSNLVMAFLWMCLFKIATLWGSERSSLSLFILLSARAGILINLLFAYLNLIPIPPLDGSRILASLLPTRYALIFQKLEPFGLFILIALMFFGILSFILSPLLHWSLRGLSLLFNI